MEREEFSRRWRNLKTPEERQRFLAEELKKELGLFDSFKNRLVRNGTSAYEDEYSSMRDNNRNAHLTQKAMFGERPVIIQNDEPSSIVNKIVEEMTNVPALIENFGSSTSQSQLSKAPTNKKPQTTTIDYNEHSKHTKQGLSNTYVKNEHPDEDNREPKPSTSGDNRLTPKLNDHKPSLKRNSSSTEVQSYKERKIESPNTAATSSGLPSNSESQSTSLLPPKRPDNHSKQSIRNSGSKTAATDKMDLFPCKLPDYALGEYHGYRIAKAHDKPGLPDSVVSINIRKIPSIKEIMTHVKNYVRRALKSDQQRPPDLPCILYLCGLMLYAIQKSTVGIVNDLLREILSILDTIRSTFLEGEKSPKSITVISAMFYLASAYCCEYLYENTLEASIKRRQLLEQCNSAFVSFDGNEELVPENFGVLLLDKNQKMFESILSDLCSKDKVNIPRLYYQLLLENSQHAMLHERHIYEKRLAIQQMENLEPVMWKHLTTTMQFKLESNSGTEIADAIFTLVYWWLNSQGKV